MAFLRKLINNNQPRNLNPNGRRQHKLINTRRQPGNRVLTLSRRRPITDTTPPTIEQLKPFWTEASSDGRYVDPLRRGVRENPPLFYRNERTVTGRQLNRPLQVGETGDQNGVGVFEGKFSRVFRKGNRQFLSYFTGYGKVNTE